jgi:beta-glucanase (GH16 family)
MRFRADPLPGYKTAWLLWPTSDTWPRDGEIDFPEGDLNSTICGFMHHMNGTSGSDQDGACSGSTYSGWHTAVLEWTPLACRFILDGKVLMAPTSMIPSTPMRWVLQTETALGSVVPSDSTAGHVQVDWVAAYSPA